MVAAAVAVAVVVIVVVVAGGGGGGEGKVSGKSSFEVLICLPGSCHQPLR